MECDTVFLGRVGHCESDNVMDKKNLKDAINGTIETGTSG